MNGAQGYLLGVATCAILLAVAWLVAIWWEQR